MTFEFIAPQLLTQQQHNLFRHRTCITQNGGREIVVDGKNYLNFSSNDYLGLNNHPDINKAMQEGVDKFGICAGGSSLITGFHYAHQALEACISEWLNKPRCLLFSSGFAANAGLFQALGHKNTHFWLDKLSHASMIDGARHGDAELKRFAHNDVAALEQMFARAAVGAQPQRHDHLIASEGVFSMDGDMANVKQLSLLAKAHQAWLYLDDAHSIGVIGDYGQGSVSEAPVDIVMATFGKAIATNGAFIACEQNLHDYLINFSRHYIYSTAISPAMAWATKKSIEIIQQEGWRRDKIKTLSAQLIRELNAEFTVLPSDSSIHAIVIGDEEKTLAVSKKLKEQGIWLSAIRPPTVPKNSSRLRVTVCASHNNKDISYLANVLNEVTI